MEDKPFRDRTEDACLRRPIELIEPRLSLPIAKFCALSNAGKRALSDPPSPPDSNGSQQYDHYTPGCTTVQRTKSVPVSRARQRNSRPVRKGIWQLAMRRRKLGNP